MKLSETKAMARRAYEARNQGKPVEDLTKVKNENSTHDPKTLPKPEKDEE